MDSVPYLACSVLLLFTCPLNNKHFPFNSFIFFKKKRMSTSYPVLYLQIPTVMSFKQLTYNNIYWKLEKKLKNT